MTRIFKPVDLLSLLFLAALTVTVLTHLTAIPHARWLLMRFGLVTVAITALAYYASHAHSWRPAKRLSAYLPVLIIPVVFDSMGDIIPWVRDRIYDDVLIALDYALFGVHPTIWFEQFITPLTTNLLQLAYVSYYPMPVVVASVLAARRKWPAFDRVVFGFVLCFYLSYAGYVLIPAVGPRFTIEHATDLQGSDLTDAIQETLNRLENTKTDAFPSGHTAIALLCLFYALREREKVLAALLAPLVIGLIISTVYLRYHYVIDVIAGILLAAGTVAVAPWAYARLGGSDGESRDHLHHRA